MQADLQSFEICQDSLLSYNLSTKNSVAIEALKFNIPTICSTCSSIPNSLAILSPS